MHVGGETRSPKQRFGITNLLDFTRQNGVGQASAFLKAARWEVRPTRTRRAINASKTTYNATSNLRIKLVGLPRNLYANENSTSLPGAAYAGRST